MPLGPRTPRHLAHRRSLECCGYRRDDGLWDIEAHLVDVKPQPFQNHDHPRVFQPGEPIHDMRFRLTIDLDFLVHEVEISVDGHPFEVCPSISARYQQLVGLRIGPGWNRKLKTLFGGTGGCTHLSELLGPIASTAYQTLHPAREERERRQRHRQPPPILDTCHALDRHGDVVRLLWPAFAVDRPD